MIKFRTLSKRMFLQKWQLAHFTLVLQLLAIIFCSIMIATRSNSDFISWIGIAQEGSIASSVSALLVQTTILADMIFFALIYIKGLRMLLSQTWHLLPISSSKLYLANLLTNVLSCAYIFVIQIIGVLAGEFILSLVDKKYQFWQFLGENFQSFTSQSSAAIMDDLAPFIFLILIVLFLTSFVDFTNFSSRVVTDFLPLKNIKWVRWAINVILMIICMYLFMKLDTYFGRMYYSQASKLNYIAQNLRFVNISNLELLFGTIIFGGIDIYLINRYLETRIK